MNTRIQDELIAITNPREFVHPDRLITSLVQVDLPTVNSVLNKYPRALDDAKSPLIELFFWAALIGDYKTLGNLFSHPVFKGQKIKKNLLREVVNGCMRRADILVGKKPDPKNIPAITMAYEQALLHLGDLYFKEPTDNEIAIKANQRLIKLYSNQISLFKYQGLYNVAALFSKAKANCEVSLVKVYSLTDATSDPASIHIDDRSVMITAATRWGFNYHGIPQDGNCFFHAIAHQAEINNMSLPVLDATMPLHQYYRLQAVNTMNHNRQYFLKYFIPDNDDERKSKTREQLFEEYLDTMMQLREWADDLSITALAIYLNVTLVIVKCNDKNPHIIKLSTATHRLHIGYEGNNHYVSLLNNIENAELEAMIEKELPLDLANIIPILDFDENTGLTTPSVSRSTSFASSLHSLSQAPTPTPTPRSLTPSLPEKKDKDDAPLLPSPSKLSFETTTDSPTASKKKSRLTALGNMFSNLFKTPEDEVSNSTTSMLTLAQAVQNVTPSKGKP